MAVMLKLLCLVLWVLIAVFLVIGEIKTRQRKFRGAASRMKDDNSVGIDGHRAFMQSGPEDRIIIQGVSSSENLKIKRIINRIIKKRHRLSS